MMLNQVILNVENPQRLARFYSDVLGMSITETPSGSVAGYFGDGVEIAIRQSTGKVCYQYSAADYYWKIGITLPDLDYAYSYLRSKGVDVSKPKQFQDIGYLCHLKDPEGFVIELLQHTFESSPLTAKGNEQLALGGGAQIGQVTLRVSDIQAALQKYQVGLGMRLLSIQPVQDFGFTLYFLAYTDESPPGSDLTDPDNREWLWQRSYTTLELQHLHQGRISPRPDSGDAGYQGLVASTESGELIVID